MQTSPGREPGTTPAGHDGLVQPIQINSETSNMGKTAKLQPVEAPIVTIAAPLFGQVRVNISGESPYVQHKFSEKARRQMLATQEAGSTAKSKKKREARDIHAEYEAAIHRDEAGNAGIPAPALRSAMISACRLVGFQMTKAKLSIFVLPDCFDADEGTPLFRIYGEPEMHQAAVRLESGVASISIRPMWRTWHATPTIRWDKDQFTTDDVINLLARAGQQVGLGEGRPDSRRSHGMGWGTFAVGQVEEIRKRDDGFSVEAVRA